MLQIRCLPSPCSRLSRPRTTTKAPPHPRANSRQRACPPPKGGEGDRMVPTFTADRSTGRRPAFPLQPRHEYAADLPRGLRADHEITDRRSRPPDQGMRALPSAHIRQVGADAALEGVPPLVRSRYTFPSRLPARSRLAVPTRPVVVGAAPIHTLRLQGRTAPSFNDPLRRAAVGSLIPLGQSTPRGAPPASNRRRRPPSRPAAPHGRRTLRQRASTPRTRAHSATCCSRRPGSRGTRTHAITCALWTSSPAVEHSTIVSTLDPFRVASAD